MQVRPHLTTIARLTAAAVVTYLVIGLFQPHQSDLTGPLTALLVVQASSVGTLKMGLVRVGAVMSGVLVAVGVASLVGITWWSLGIVIALALIVASTLRLREQLLEAPISAMLILGSAVTDQAAQTRVLLTLTGAVLGMAFGLVVPPPLPISLASSRVRQVSDGLADQLSAAGETLAQSSLTRSMVDGWLSQLRRINSLVDEAANVVDELSSGRRFNTRALAAADVGPLLRTGLDTLENCLLAVRALFVQIRSELPADARTSSGYDDDLRAVFAVVLQHAAESIRGFGALVDAEAHGRGEQAQMSFVLSLEMLREAKAILTELMLTGSDDATTWLLRGSTLGAVEQVLLQLNLESRSKVRAEWQASQARRLGAHLPVLVRDALPQAERPLPKLLERGLREVVNRDVGVGLVRGSRKALRRSRDFLVPDFTGRRQEAKDVRANSLQPPDAPEVVRDDTAPELEDESNS